MVIHPNSFSLQFVKLIDLLLLSFLSFSNIFFNVKKVLLTRFCKMKPPTYLVCWADIQTIDYNMKIGIETQIHYCIDYKVQQRSN